MDWMWGEGKKGREGFVPVAAAARRLWWKHRASPGLRSRQPFCWGIIELEVPVR